MNAVAVGAYELHDHLPFTQWLRSCLIPVRCLSCGRLRASRPLALLPMAAQLPDTGVVFGLWAPTSFTTPCPSPSGCAAA